MSPKVHLSTQVVNFGNIKQGCTYVQAVTMKVDQPGGGCQLTSSDLRNLSDPADVAAGVTESDYDLCVHQPTGHNLCVRLANVIGVDDRARLSNTWSLEIQLAADTCGTIEDRGCVIQYGPHSFVITIIANIVQPRAYERLMTETPRYIRPATADSTPTARVIAATALPAAVKQMILIPAAVINAERKFQKRVVPFMARLTNDFLNPLPTFAAADVCVSPRSLRRPSPAKRDARATPSSPRGRNVSPPPAPFPLSQPQPYERPPTALPGPRAAIPSRRRSAGDPTVNEVESIALPPPTPMMRPIGTAPVLSRPQMLPVSNSSRVKMHPRSRWVRPQTEEIGEATPLSGQSSSSSISNAADARNAAKAAAMHVGSMSHDAFVVDGPEPSPELLTSLNEHTSGSDVLAELASGGNNNSPPPAGVGMDSSSAGEQNVLLLAESARQAPTSSWSSLPSCDMGDACGWKQRFDELSWHFTAMDRTLTTFQSDYQRSLAAWSEALEEREAIIRRQEAELRRLNALLSS